MVDITKMLRRWLVKGLRIRLDFAAALSDTRALGRRSPIVMMRVGYCLRAAEAAAIITRRYDAAHARSPTSTRRSCRRGGMNAEWLNTRRDADRRSRRFIRRC